MKRRSSVVLISVILCLALFLANLIYAVVIAATFQTDDSVKIMLDIEDKGRYDEFLAEIERQNPDIKVTAIYGKDLSVLIGTADEPDIIKTGNVQLASMRTHLEKIDVNPDVLRREYYGNIAEAMIFDGAVYAIPTSVNVSLLYYNKDVFDANAEELRGALGSGAAESVYPNENWTHGDFQKAGVALTKKQGNLYTQWGCTTTLDWWGEWMAYINQYGGSFYLPGSDNRVSGLGSAEALKATQFMYEKSMGEKKFAPRMEEIGVVNFTAGNVGMIFGGHTGLFGSYNALGMNWDIEVLPTPDGAAEKKGGEVSADCFGVYKGSKNKEKALRVLKYWTGKEAAILQYGFGKISARKDMKEYILSVPKEERAAPKNMEAFFKAIERSTPLPNERYFETAARTALVEIQRMLSGGFDAATALQRAEKAVNNYYRNMYAE